MNPVHYQMETLSADRLSEPVAADAARDALLVRIGREYVAVWLDAVVSQHNELEVRPLPDWRPGVAGLLRAGERFVPLYRPDETLGIARDDASVEQCAIVVRSGDSSIALAIDEPLDVMSITAASLKQPPAAIAEDGIVQALVWFDGALVSVLDPRALVAACQSPVAEPSV
jgi:chemotaxis signal transduction protein